MEKEVVDNMDKLDVIFDFLERHPYMSALAVIGGAIGFIIDNNTEKKEV